MKFARHLLVACVLASFAAVMVGCEAHGKVGDPDGSGSSSGTTYKKETTTVRQPDGDTRTTTEVHRNP